MPAALAALAAAFLPYRWWNRFPTIQVERFALMSALSTIVLGFLLAIVGFFEFVESGGARGSVQAAAFATVTFALTTPKGIVATYLILSGMFRTATAYVGDWYGDPLLTAIVTATTETRTRQKDNAARNDRLRREGVEAPDRVYSGEWAGLPQAELVVIASRRKKDWKAGVVVITPDKAYRLGEPFDETTVHGLRTIYPLMPLEPGQLIRRSVSYDLPPLRER